MSAFRYAARSLGRARVFSVAATLTIALAVGAGCAVFGLVNAVLLRPLPYPDADRLVGIWHTMPAMNLPIVKQSPGTYVLYRDASRAFEEIGIYVSMAATLAYPDRDLPPERVRLGWMTPSTFAVLGAKPLFGRLFTDADAPASAPPVVVIGERLWRSRFGGDRRVLGQHLDVDGEAREIIGVMPESFVFPNARTPLWAPNVDVVNPRYVGGFGYDGIARLRPQVTAAAAQRELQQILTRLPERFPQMRPDLPTALGMKQTGIAPIVHDMRDDVVAGFDRVLWLVGATVALLVIVAFSNVASLLLVRMESRRRELAVHEALGASRLGVWRLLMAESVLIVVTGAALGLALAAVSLALLVRAAPLGLPRLNEVRVDASVVVLAAALIGLFVVLSASLAAWRTRSADTMRILRDGGRTGTIGRATHRLRAAFVAVDVALSLVLLAGAGVLGRSVWRLLAVQPGFDQTDTFTFWTFLPDTRYAKSTDAARFYREAIDRFGRLPGVIAVGTTAKLPLEIEGFPYRILIWADDGSTSTNVLPPPFQTTSTSASYFGAMRIPLIAGRTYDDANIRRGAREAVVSRGFVQFFWHDATGRSGVGKRLRASANGEWLTIVGVVGDVRDSTLTQAPVAEVYVPEEPIGDSPDATPHTTARDMAFVVRTRGPVPGLPQRLRQELHALDPQLPFYRPAMMDDVVADARTATTFALLLLVAGAVATLALGVVGLYGVIAYVVKLRSREISIRIALGLEPGAAARLILRQGQAIVAVGVVAGLGAFLLFAKLLASLAFEVRPVDGPTLGASLAMVVLVATIATWLPARRAAGVDPARTLNAD
jgi:predicted permease